MDSPPNPPPPPDTRESLLNAAETLFSEIGIEAASLRAITGAAGANLAAVHYHFGSKQELVKAVFVRRLGPLNQERLRRLEESIAQDDSVEGVVRALVAPLLELFRQQPESARAVVTLIGRAFSDPQGEVKRVLKEQFSEIVERFVAELGRLLPELRREEVVWRFHFAAGAMAHVASTGHLLEGGLGCAPEPETAIEQLVHFLSAGLRAPALDPHPLAPSPTRTHSRPGEGEGEEAESTLILPALAGRRRPLARGKGVRVGEGNEG